MSSINDLIATMCPDGVELQALGDVGEFIRGRRITKDDFVESGVGCIHYGEIYTRYGTTASETFSFVRPELAVRLRLAQSGDLIIAATGENAEEVCKAVAWLGADEIAIHDDCYLYRHGFDPTYISHLFQSSLFHDQKIRFAAGAKMVRVSGEKLAKIRVPVPPLAVQREVVEILNQMESLEAELATALRAEQEARRQQYVHYRDSLFAFEPRERVRWATLSDVCLSVSSGGTPSTGRPEYYSGVIPWLRTQEVDYSVIESTDVTITEAGMRNSAAKWIPANCVIVAMYGATAAKVAITGIPLTTNQACCNLQIDPEQASHRYVFHWIANEYLRLKALGEGSQSNLNAQKVKRYPIPVPPLDEQERLVEVLDKFDALVNDLSVGLPAELRARRRQYEHYRDRLLSLDRAAA